VTPPPVASPFVANCDECGKEYSYGPEEILRLELAPPESFTPHPLFGTHECGATQAEAFARNQKAAYPAGLPPS
jgi:hypothetical protein